MIGGHTGKCVRCFKPATIWGGHVLDKDRKKIIAGWCSKKCSEIAGFYGHWKREMGRRSE